MGSSDLPVDVSAGFGATIMMIATGNITAEMTTKSTVTETIVLIHVIELSAFLKSSPNATVERRNETFTRPGTSPALAYCSHRRSPVSVPQTIHIEFRYTFEKTRSLHSMIDYTWERFGKMILSIGDVEKRNADVFFSLVGTWSVGITLASKH